MKSELFESRQVPWWQVGLACLGGLALASALTAADLDIVRSIGSQPPAKNGRDYVLAVQSTMRGQCHGHTKAGTSCRAKAASDSLYCRAHDPSLPRCGAVLHSGSICSTRVAAPGERCVKHTIPANWHAPLALPRRAK